MKLAITPAKNSGEKVKSPMDNNTAAATMGADRRKENIKEVDVVGDFRVCVFGYGRCYGKNTPKYRGESGADVVRIDRVCVYVCALDYSKTYNEKEE